MTLREILDKAIRPSEGWREMGKDTEVGFSIDEKYGEILVISFQGSLSLLDWVFNLKAWMKEGFHAGIREKWLIVKDEVLREILKRNKRKILLTGHSQGAGMALVGYLELRNILTSDFSLSAYLFGCPKVVGFKRFFKERKKEGVLVNIQAKTDIVPYLNPFCFSLGERKVIGKWKIPSHRDHYPNYYKKFL